MKHILVKTTAFIRLGRFMFLLGGVVFYNLGVVIAQYEGAKLNLIAWGWGQFIVTLVQLMVHYSNDYFDVAADRANLTPTRWSGGSRVLVLETIHSRTALLTAIVLLLSALLSTLLLYLTIAPGFSAVLLILLAVFLSWFYSAPPLRLHSRGIGELCAALVVSIITPMIGFYLQTNRLSLLLISAVLPLFFLQLTMLLRVAVDDIGGDGLSSKHTMAFRLGFKGTLKLIAFCLFLAYVLLWVLITAGILPVMISAVFLTLPLGGLILWYTVIEIRKNSPHRRVITFLTISLLVSNALLELVAFRLAS